MRGTEAKPPGYIVDPMLKWEDTMSSLAGKRSDCTDALLRLHMMLNEFPWLRPRLEPLIELQESIRDGIEETMNKAYQYWNGRFWEPLRELGFNDPEPG